MAPTTAVASPPIATSPAKVTGAEPARDAKSSDQKQTEQKDARLRLLVSPRADLLASAEVQAEGPIFDLGHQLSDLFARTRAALPPGSTVSPATMDAAKFSELDAAVRSLMRAYSTTQQDWRQFAIFNEHHYVRHLVDASDDFELIVICWAPGQFSRVHNHANAHCWLTCLDGTVVEEKYKPDELAPPKQSPRSEAPTVPGVLSAETSCPQLTHVGRGQLQVGETGYINDSIALHAVGSPADVPAPGSVTLHLYAPPIRKVKLYEPEEGRVLTRVPGFFSVRGRRNPSN